ncbi:hypothetical protein GOBAR_DD10531 [Gossypium barbadense]|nr:hypothetical protein GOBAR_DD10531 [Gossypium barbadense]
MVAETRRERMSEVAPFAVMLIMEGCTIALTILAKTALTAGISPFVFVVYTNAVGSILLLPFSFLYHRGERVAISQNLAFLGLSYSSPIVVCAMGLLMPTISFLLSIILRTARLDWRSTSSQAKMIGTFISIAGAIFVELYKGPFTRPSPVSLDHHLQVIPKLFVFYSTPDRWVLGGILLAAATLSISVWNIVQGVFGSIIRSNVHIACTRMKGPFYVPMFKPFGVVFATVLGTCFFTNSLHYGRLYSVIGTIIVGTGYYAVMWGQIREEELRKEREVEKVGDISDLKAPLLQENEDAQV